MFMGLANPSVSLDDKYVLEQGRVFMTGVQALVRLPIMQRQRDAAAGLNTACFISGYRGSPLGGFDQALWEAGKLLDAKNIRFQPGINASRGSYVKKAGCRSRPGSVPPVAATGPAGRFAG